MSRSRTQFGSSIPTTMTTRSGAYNSTSRPLPPISTGSVSTLARNIEAGHMNISTAGSLRTRPVSRHNRQSPERPVKILTATAALRSRMPSQDRSITHTNPPVNTYTERRLSRPTATFYSIQSAPPLAHSPDNEPTTPKTFTVDRRISNAPVASTEPKLNNGGLCGLQNLGNTCFMNSVLQCLSNTKPLLLFCLEGDLDDCLNTSNTSVMKGISMKEYASLVRKMWLQPEGRSLVSPLSFKNTIGKFAPRFTGYSEQDSQEFLRYLLQGLSEDVNRIQRKPVPIIINEKEEERMKEKDRAKASWDRCLRYENSPLVDIFAGQLKSTLECSHCQYQSITFDMFWDLSLPLPREKSSTNLQECIQLFMSKEELDGNEKPMCAKCKQKRPCTKQLSIQKCPDILVLHLKRFSQTRGRSKLNTHVDFPITNLRLSGLPDVMSESHEGVLPTYNLFGISNHSGTVYSGHYTAQCKHPFTHEWHEFNDSSVYPINDNSRIISSNAYVLFYERNRS